LGLDSRDGEVQRRAAQGRHPAHAEGLKISSHGKRVAFEGAGRTVTNGPFAPPRELVAGFWLWKVKDMDEAVAWVKCSPNPMPEPCEIEIRPIAEGGEPQ